MTPRRWFHVLLGAGFVPVLSLPLVWGVAFATRRRAADADARRWSRRILALAVADTAVAAVLVALVTGALPTEWRTVGAPVLDPRRTAATAPRDDDPVVLGVLPDRAFQGTSAKVGEVATGSPADAAGVRPGDVVVALDGAEIADFPALGRAVRASEPGVPVPLVVVRGGATVPLTITPRRWSELPRASPRPAAPAERLDDCAPHVPLRSASTLAAIVGALATLGALVWVRARARAAAGAVWLIGVALVAHTVAGLAVGTGACRALGDVTSAGAVLAACAGTIVLGATALPGLRLVRGVDAPAERTWSSAVALGGWYLATGVPRVAVVVGAATLAALGPGPVESLVGRLAEDRAWGPLLLLAADAVVIAPVAEEVAFRGVLQPALGRWLAPGAAVAATSVLFASAHSWYGPKLPMVLLVAAVLGWARVASGGLRAPITLHAIVNAVNLAALLILAG